MRGATRFRRHDPIAVAAASRHCFDVFLSLLIYLGLLLAALGALSILVPLRPLGIRSRGRGLVLAVLGVVLAALAMFWPAGEVEAARGTLLDDFLPVYHFHELHTAVIQAPPARVYRAIRDVTPGEIRWLPQLLWMRSPRGPLTANEKVLYRKPILDLATRGGFVMLANAPPQELVVGTIGQFWSGRSLAVRSPREFRAFRRPGWARVAMNFRVVPLRDGSSKVTTETRIVATDAAARRKFGAYWRTIYPGSAIIRREWLGAIERRAEAPARGR